MRMLRVALVLVVLASFVAAAMGIAMAATVTPPAKTMANQTAKATMKPTGTMMPINKTGKKMIDMQQMKSTLDGIYKKLVMNVQMPAKPAKPANNTTAMGGAKKATGDTAAKKSLVKYSPSMKLTTPAMRSMPSVGSITQLGSMPKVSGTPMPKK